MATGGDITEITFNHPTIGQGIIVLKSGEDNTQDLGGKRSADDANMIATNGEMIDQINIVRWSQEVTVANDDLTRQDLDKMVQMAGDVLLADWTISYASGSVYKGKGKPVGDLAANVNQATFPLKIAGGGVLKKII